MVEKKLRIMIRELPQNQEVSPLELQAVLGGTTFRVNSKKDHSTIIKSGRCSTYEWVPFEDSYSCIDDSDS